MSQPWQIGVVVLGAAISALSCTIAAEIISENVKARFQIPSPFLLLMSENELEQRRTQRQSVLSWKFRLICSSCLIVLTWLTLILRSLEEIGLQGVAVGAIAGLLSFLLLFWGVQVSYVFIRRRSTTIPPFMGNFIYRLLTGRGKNDAQSSNDTSSLVEGYFDKSSRLIPEHLLNVIFGVFGLIIYLTIINLFKPGGEHFGLGELPALLPNLKLSDWRQDVIEGNLPIPVFNGTLMEDGRRFLISPITFIDGQVADLDHGNNPEERAPKALDFNTLFLGYDLKVTTAARLSATFPYVSPISRNSKIVREPKQLEFNYHVADGGYFDNSGLFTLVEWLDDNLETFRNKLNIKRVLLLEISAFPDSVLQEQQGDKGWFTAWVGPLITLNSVRDSTQIARNLRESNLLEHLWDNQDVEIKSFPIFFPSGYDQPLSWKLTAAERKNIEDAWNDYKETTQFEKIKSLWKKWNVS